MGEPGRILVRCLGVCDGTISVAGDRTHHAAALFEQTPQGLHVIACGAASDVEAHPEAGIARTIDCTDSVVLPGLINAHTHLDLTVIGPLPHEPRDGFASWVSKIRSARPTEPAAIEASVAAGVAMSRAGGVVAVGDIAGAVRGSASLLSARALQSSGMAGVSFIEFFAIGPTERERANAAIELVHASHSELCGRHRLGLQPHATNTVSEAAFETAVRAAGELGVPLMTHLAESPEEQRLVAEASGPQRALLEDLGLWNASVENEFGRGVTPIAKLAPVLRGSRTAAVHVNQCDDADLKLLIESNLPVVYCPRASSYFGAEHHFGPHRYREMIDAGITVAIGTDSIVNLPQNSEHISPLDDLRFLFRRDGIDASTLLRMATTSAASVLRMDRDSASFVPSSRPLGVIAIPVAEHDIPNPAASALRSESAPQWVLEAATEVPRE
ncbi:MAG: amidohydrolase family protein [Planctomycetota bacterium]